VPRSSPGYILLETAVTYVIVSFTIVSLASVVTLSLEANTASEASLICGQLAHELLQEIQLRKWDQNWASSQKPAYPALSPSATLGVDSGENASNKTTFNDIDDFNGWTESPPQDPMGNTLSQFVGFSRSVTVQYVTSSLAVSASPTNYKEVTVCVSKKLVNELCLNWIATNH
jgi:Tfp pilus assembly protein PilV